MAATNPSVAKHAFVEGSVWYVALKDHAATCDDCLSEWTLAIISLRVTGELVFEPHFCSEGDRLLANVSRALQQHELAMSFPSRDDDSATQSPPRDRAVVALIPTPKEVTH